MITIKRSTDSNGDVCWVAHRRDGDRCFQLYLGSDVNGAIGAAVGAGMGRDEAVSMANREISRRQTNDNIG